MPEIPEHPPEQVPESRRLLIWWLALPMVGLLALSLASSHSFLISRYTLPMAPALWLLAAGIIAQFIHGWWQHGVVLLTIVVASFVGDLLPNVKERGCLHNRAIDGWEGAALQVNREGQPGDLVLLVGGFVEVGRLGKAGLTEVQMNFVRSPLKLSLDPRKQYRLEVLPMRLDADNLAYVQDVMKAVNAATGVWLVGSGHDYETYAQGLHARPNLEPKSRTVHAVVTLIHFVPPP